jgi:hypothetical protein
LKLRTAGIGDGLVGDIWIVGKTAMRSAIYAPFWQARVREIWRSRDREPGASVVLAKE